MALSWARKSAVPPVSSPARQDRCKVGGQRKNQGINSSIQNMIQQCRCANEDKPLKERQEETEGETRGDQQLGTVGVCVKGYFKIDGRGWERL